MSKEMKIDRHMIRNLRELRGWSQEQLAEAAGLGVRTVQRVESEGRASAETRTCLAAAFNVPQTALAATPSVTERVQQTADPILGLVGTFLIVVGLLSNQGQGLLLAGTGILIAMLCVQALLFIDYRREAAGREPLLHPAGTSIVGLLVAGLSAEGLGWAMTGGPVWAGLAVAAFGVALAGGHWLFNRLVGEEASSGKGDDKPLAGGTRREPG